MKTILIITLCGLLNTVGIAQTTRYISDVDNKTINLDTLQGRKILLIVLPLEIDTAIINQLLRFQKKYEKKVKVLGLVNTKQGAPTKEFYKDAYNEATRSGITVTEGLVSTDTIANERASVVQWVTGKNNDRRADRYATGSKYFLSEEGRLYAQLGRDISLDDRIVQNIMNTNVPKAISRLKPGTTKGTPASKN
jgi:hypothetical protein